MEITRKSKKKQIVYQSGVKITEKSQEFRLYIGFATLIKGVIKGVFNYLYWS